MGLTLDQLGYGANGDGNYDILKDGTCFNIDSSSNDALVVEWHANGSCTISSSNAVLVLSVSGGNLDDVNNISIAPGGGYSAYANGEEE